MMLLYYISLKKSHDNQNHFIIRVVTRKTNETEHVHNVSQEVIKNNKIKYMKSIF